MIHDIISFRDAHACVANLEDDRELADIYHRARESGDVDLAVAAVYRAEKLGRRLNIFPRTH